MHEPPSCKPDMPCRLGARFQLLADPGNHASIGTVARILFQQCLVALAKLGWYSEFQTGIVPNAELAAYLALRAKVRGPNSELDTEAHRVWLGRRLKCMAVVAGMPIFSIYGVPDASQCLHVWRTHARTCHTSLGMGGKL